MGLTAPQSGNETNAGVEIKMAAEAAALLDQLMGAYRDVGPDENVRQREWSDPEVKHSLIVP